MKKEERTSRLSSVAVASRQGNSDDLIHQSDRRSNTGWLPVESLDAFRRISGCFRSDSVDGLRRNTQPDYLYVQEILRRESEPPDRYGAHLTQTREMPSQTVCSP
jgi:hypothetical protein